MNSRNASCKIRVQVVKCICWPYFFFFCNWQFTCFVQLAIEVFLERRLYVAKILTFFTYYIHCKYFPPIFVLFLFNFTVGFHTPAPSPNTHMNFKCLYSRICPSVKTTAFLQSSSESSFHFKLIKMVIHFFLYGFLCHFLIFKLLGVYFS